MEDCACVHGFAVYAHAEVGENRCSSMFRGEFARWFAPQAHHRAVNGLHLIDFA